MKLSEKLKNSIPQLTGDFETYKKTVDGLLANASDEKERELIEEFIKETITADSRQLVTDTKILCLKVQLYEYNDVIPYSYIAKKYFNKSKAWLSQRVNGYDVNRKKAKFTEQELETFSFAIQDISKKLGSITL